jgi:tetratricopeptide (TPR) repeat protein
MDIKDTQHRPEPMPNVPPEREQQPIQLPGVIRADSQALWADLDRARKEHLLGHYAEAEQAVRKVIGTELVVTTPLKRGGTEEGQVFLIRASAWTLLGRIRQRLGDQRLAQTAFGRAVDLFDRVLRETKSANAGPLQTVVALLGRLIPQTPSVAAQHYADYGIALYMVGRKDEATALLEKAIALGDSAAETRYCLGMNLQERNMHDKAERVLREALRYAPAEPLVHAGPRRDFKVPRPNRRSNKRLSGGGE